MARGGQRQSKTNRANKETIKTANSARHRLLSIQHDVHGFLKHLVLYHWLSQKPSNSSSESQYDRDKTIIDTSSWPIFSNERCGSVRIYHSSYDCTSSFHIILTWITLLANNPYFYNTLNQ